MACRLSRNARTDQRSLPNHLLSNCPSVASRRETQTMPATPELHLSDNDTSTVQHVFVNMRPNHSFEPTVTGKPASAAQLKRYVSHEPGLSYQVSPQWTAFTVPAGVRGFRTAPSRWHLSRACCVAAPPLLRAGCPSRKLAASEPPVRLDANTNSSPLPLATAYPREPLLHSTAAGPGWPPTATHRSGLPKVGSTSLKERMRQHIVLVHTGVSTKNSNKRGPNRFSRPSDET